VLVSFFVFDFNRLAAEIITKQARQHNHNPLFFMKKSIFSHTECMVTIFVCGFG